MNRRAHPRRVSRRTVRLGTISETPFPSADLIDASVAGVLLSFAEPVVLSPGQRVCVSVPGREGALHLMASVVRVERGHDFHTYVGLVLSERPSPADLVDPDLERWRAWLEDERFERLLEDETDTAHARGELVPDRRRARQLRPILSR